MSLHAPTYGRSIVLLAASVVATGCGGAARKQPIFEAPGIVPTIAEEIVLLPVLDVRVDKQIKVDLQKQIREKVRDALRKRGYLVRETGDSAQVGTITEEDLRDATPEWIRRLGPPDAPWVMVLTLQDVKTRLTFGSTGNAEMAGYLYDRTTGSLVWRDKGIGQAGQGGLAGMLMKGSMDNAAIARAVDNLVASIPKRPKQRP